MLKMKRMISLLLALVMVFGMLPPVAVYAEETETAAQETTAPAESMEFAENTEEETFAPVESATEATQSAVDPTAETMPEETIAAVDQTEPKASFESNEGSFFAASTVASGTCGENLTWTLNDNGILSISGTGDMTEYSWWSDVPWSTYRTSIKEVVISEGVTSLCESAFYECNNLVSVTIPSSITNISSSAFSYCQSLNTVVIPETVVQIESFAFYYCTSLNSITIPNNVTYIGNHAFSHCSKLTDLTIGESVSEMDGYVFSYCTSLVNVIIEEGVSSIGNYAFSNCSSLKSISLPNSITLIGKYAFEYCTELTEVNFGNGITKICSYAFQRCYGLTKVTIPDSVLSIEDHAFYCCTGLKELDIGNGATSIGAYSFFNCTSLTSVSIPSQVSVIGEYAFCRCDNLAGFWVSDLNKNYSSDTNGVLYNKTKTKLIQAHGKLDGTYIVSDTVIDIGIHAFYELPNIIKITIPDNVLSIGKKAFYKCTNMTSVIVGYGVKEIGDYAFDSCDKIKDITFKGDAPLFDYGVFYYVTTTVYYPDGNSTWTDDIMQNYKGTITWVPYNPEEIPGEGEPGSDTLMDFFDNDAIEINGSGRAYGFYVGEPNTQYVYKVNGLESTAESNEKGVFQISLGEFTSAGKHKVITEITRIGGEELKTPLKLDATVTVTPLSFSQEWEISLDAKVGASIDLGVGGEAGPAEVKASLAGAGAKVGYGTALKLSREYSAEGETVELTSDISLDGEVEVSNGITGKALSSKFSVAEASAQVSGGITGTYGLEIENYSPSSTKQQMAIGTFVLGEALLAAPNAIMLKPFYNWMAQSVYANSGCTVIQGAGAALSTKSGVELGTIRVNDSKIFSSADVGAKTAISFSDIAKSNGEVSKTTSMTTDVNLSILTASGEDGNLSADISALSWKFLGKDVKVSAKQDTEGKSITGTTLSALDSRPKWFILGEHIKSEYDKYTFKDESLQVLLNRVPNYNAYLNGSRSLLTGEDIKDMANTVSESEEKIEYNSQTKDEMLYALPLEIGAKIIAGLNLGVSMSYLESTDYVTSSGYAVNDEILLAGESNDLSSSVDSRKKAPYDIFLDGVRSLSDAAAEFFDTVAGTIKDGVSTAWGWITENTQSGVNWVVSIVTPDGHDSASAWNASYTVAIKDSRKAAALPAGIADRGAERNAKAATIGRTFLVRVTDGSTGEDIVDLSAEPLEFTIRYAREDLEAAGLNIYHPSVKSGGIAMYRYSNEGDYFEYVGGVNDLEKMTVTANITKAGQYVLAVDSCAPELSYLDISDFRTNPTITAYVDDMSGMDVSGFVFKLDGEVKVDGSNAEEYYNTEAAVFTYTVPQGEELSEGEHTMSFTLADTTGNVETYEYSFNVDLTAPVISEVSVSGHPNEGSAVEVRAQIGDLNLTEVYAIFSKLLPDGTWSREVATPMGDMGNGLWGLDYEGNGSSVKVYVRALDIGENKAESNAYEVKPFAESIVIAQEYVVLRKGQNCKMTAVVTPAELQTAVEWSTENDKIVSVSQSGVITGTGTGTTYVTATVFDGEAEITARCRVDVTEALELDGVQLNTTKVTSELYSTDYAEFDLLLELPQNVSFMSTDDREIPESNSVAIEEAWFTASTAKVAFDLIPLDDRRIAIVPTDYAVDYPEELLKSYKSQVTVVVDGEEYTTEEVLTLTLKQSKPKIKATIPAFNSFYTGQTQTITFTGGTVTSVSDKDIPEWLNLNSDFTLSLNENAGTKNSGKAVLLADAEGWIIPVEVSLSVKNAYKAPDLKLSETSVKMTANAADSSGIALTLMPKSKTDTLSGLHVKDITVADEFEYSIEKFNAETGTFTLKAENGFRPGTVVLNVSFSDTGEVLPLNLKVAVQNVSLKLSPASVTLNRNTGDMAQIHVTAAPADYRLTALDIGGNDGFFETTYENGILTVVPTAAAEAGKTYSLTVSAGGSKAVTLKIKVTEDTPTVTLKAKGNIDLSFLKQTVTVTPAFKNHASGEIADYTATVTAPDGSTSDAFEVRYENGAFLVTCKDTEIVTGTYRLYLSMKVNDDVTLETDAKLNVKRTAVKLKLDPSKLTLNKAVNDLASVAVTCTTKGYDFSEEPIWELLAKNKKDSAEGRLDIAWNNGQLDIAVNDSTEPGAVYNLQVKANAYAPAVNLGIKIVDTKPTVSLKASGTIDVIREGTSIIVTPGYKNCMDADKTETLNVYSSADDYAEPVNELFRIEKDEMGRYVLAAASGLDHTKSYKVELESVVSGIAVTSAKTSVKVKMGSAKLTLSADGNTIFGNDSKDRIGFRITAQDESLKGVKEILSKDERFEVVPYGNGEFALAFKDETVDRTLPGKTVTVSLNVFLEGNETTETAKPKSNATLKLKVSIVK